MKSLIILALVAAAVAVVLFLALRQPEVRAAGSDLKQDTTELGRDAKDGVNDAYDATKDGVKDAYDTTKDAAQDASDKVQETVK